MVNSNGIAVDPKCVLYPFGGEINTPPTGSIKAQVGAFSEVLEFHPYVAINHRSNLHLHIRVPGLKDDLKILKRISKYIKTNEGYLDKLEPIVKPLSSQFDTDEEYAGALRRFRRRGVSHHTTLTEGRYQAQQAAKTFQEFLEAECPKDSAGKAMFHLSPRPAVNLRQLVETDTIEFRHFPGTLDPLAFEQALQWCRDFLYQAITDGLSTDELLASREYNIPKFKKYVHWRECLYRMTVHDGTLSKEQIAANIKRILSGELSKDNYEEAEAKKKAAVTKSASSKKPSAVSKRPPPPLDKNGKPNANRVFEDYIAEDKFPGAPKVFNIRGTSGSGKTTLVYNLLLNPTFCFREILSKGKVLGYHSKKLNFFVVGKYNTPTGGCDSIQDTTTVISRVKSVLKKGSHVLYEGLMLSGMSGSQLELSSKNDFYALILNTPFEVCLGRVKKRRLARGETKPLNPENTRTKFNATWSSGEAWKGNATQVTMSSNEEAYARIMKILGVKKYPEFDFDIFAKSQEK
jgi:adenylate kinase family enzyme